MAGDRVPTSASRAAVAVVTVCTLLVVAVSPAVASDDSAARGDERDIQVIGGTNAAGGEIPFQVSIRTDGFPYCGGTLVAPRWVLTAAHCLDPAPPGITVRIGSTRTTSGGEVLTPDFAVVHPSWTGSIAGGNDLGLLRLPADAVSDPVALAVASQTALWPAGTDARVSGWGHTQPAGVPSTTLKKALLDVLSPATCASWVGAAFDAAKMVCAGEADGSPTACRGDSGGPLTVPGPGGPRQIGIVSFGPVPCAQFQDPAVFTRVDTYASWIAGWTGRPSNDRFVGATALSCNVGSLTAMSHLATEEAGEPNHAGDPGGASLWYRFTAGATGDLVLSTSGSTFDTALAVYTGTTLPGLVPVAANDDDGASSQSRVEIPVVAGTTYRVAVDGVNAGVGPEVGRVRLNWSLRPDVGRQFTDVGSTHEFVEEIGWMGDEAVSTGFPDCSYGPGRQVSRQAMAAFLFRVLWPSGTHPPASFWDVAYRSAFFREISWMVDAGVTDGFEDGSFRPGSPVTRQAMAAFLYRMAGSPPGPFPNPGFSDLHPGNPFFLEISWMVAAGVAEGFPDDTFRSGAPVTRQAMAAFLQRLFA